MARFVLFDARAKEQVLSMHFLMDVAEILRQTDQQDVS